MAIYPKPLEGTSQTFNTPGIPEAEPRPPRFDKAIGATGLHGAGVEVVSAPVTEREVHVTKMGVPERVESASNPTAILGHPANPNSDEIIAYGHSLGTEQE